MTFYDELGVPPSASPDEIRRAYRNLSKIVHPDLQTNERSRVDAESRMRRLNHIWSVLGDPEQRRQYDDAVLPLPELPQAEAVRSAASLWLETVQMPLFLMISAVLFLAAGYLFLNYESGGALFDSARTFDFSRGGSDPDPAPDSSVAEGGEGEEDPATPGVTMAQGVRRRSRADRKSDKEATRASGSSPRQEVGRTESPGPLPTLPPAAFEVSPPAPRSPAAAVAAAPDRKQEQKQSETAPAAKAEEKAERNETQPSAPDALRELEGVWLLAPVRGGSGDEKLYPPKYIELRIYAEDGNIFGKYRGNYEVHDQPISANVNFTFKGKPTPPVTKLPWTGPAGAKGEVELKLTSPRTLRVDWKTEVSGPGLDLVAGTATLVRRAN